MDSKFNKLFNTIMEDVKSSKKHVIKEDTYFIGDGVTWNDYSEQYKQLIQAKAKQFGYNAEEGSEEFDSFLFTFKYYNDKGFTLDEIKNMTKEQWDEILDTRLKVPQRVFENIIKQAQEEYGPQRVSYGDTWYDFIQDCTRFNKEYKKSTYRDAALRLAEFEEEVISVIQRELDED